MALPDDFYTFASFATLAGTAGITAVVTGAIYKAFGLPPAKVGLVAAFLVVAAGLFFADKISDVKADIVGFFNAFLVYATAAGISDFGGSKFRGGAGFAGRPFFRSWF